MSGVIIKLGGALITDKDELRTFRPEAVETLAPILGDLTSSGTRVTIVHGAGSFGHIEAKEAGLAGGHDPERSHEQARAVDSVRESMSTLNGMVVGILESNGIDCEVHPPREWAEGTGPGFTGDIERFKEPGKVHLTFGDVVDVNDSTRFGILSGDHLMERLAIEMEDTTLAVFLLNGIDGLYDRDPKDPNATLIESFTTDTSYATSLDSDKDVTGGMALKVEVSTRISSNGPRVAFVNGLDGGNLRQLLTGGDYKGTVFERAKSHERGMDR